MRAYDRVCEILVGDRDVTGLRVTFEIVTDLKPEPNSSEIKIYNMSERTRGVVQKKGAAVELTAGYSDNKAMLMRGEIRQADSMREDADWVTRLRLGDGDTFYKAKKSFSFQPGSKTGDVLGSLGKMAGGITSLGNISEFIKSIPATMQTLATGLSGVMEPQKAMASIADSAGHTMSVQNGELLFRKKFPSKEEFKVSGELLSPDTGLIGSPEHSSPDAKKNKPGVVRLRCLLNPRIRCGHPFRIQSRSVNGTFVATKVTHKGDTHGGDWYTDIEALPL